MQDARFSVFRNKDIHGRRSSRQGQILHRDFAPAFEHCMNCPDLGGFIYSASKRQVYFRSESASELINMMIPSMGNTVAIKLSDQRSSDDRFTAHVNFDSYEDVNTHIMDISDGDLRPAFSLCANCSELGGFSYFNKRAFFRSQYATELTKGKHKADRVTLYIKNYGEHVEEGWDLVDASFGVLSCS